MLEEFIPFIALIIFGNIENLVLASQGVVAGVNPIKLGGLSILIVCVWLLLGTIGTQMFMGYADLINFIGGLAIFILGIQAMVESIRG